MRRGNGGVSESGRCWRLAQTGRSVWAFLQAAVEAAWQGEAAPSLLG